MIVWDKLLKSFQYAYAGIIQTYRSEQNFKIHLFISVTVIIIAVILNFSALRMTVLLIVIGIVLALELMNTAVEKTVDLITLKRHPLAKEAKDAAAGAVLVFSIFAVIIGILLFIEPLLKSIES
ncbi:diacylglycerol kinase family protein [Fictibacillus phosphorivorans]|uniref:diacylglycerol kinase family protein n=1 Tax=Fictibacillus phosphorivorans TaxID=1221500 RepID=UPI00255A0E0C|nr:diacylglycerol kinase family protein [Fictibacillus phosphorivorans]